MYWKHSLFLFIILLVLVVAYWMYSIQEPFTKPTLTNTSIPTKKYVPKEGFNMVDREGTILRGKQSNQIPVLSTESNYDNLEAGDKYTFSGNYTAA